MFFHDELEEGHYLFLEVSDTGTGMDKETFSRVFDPFYTTKEKGRGLGLAAILGIIRGDHGTLKGNSRPGEGTTLKVLFPQAGDPCQVGRTSTTVPAGWSGTATVLVVDDNEEVLGICGRMLGEYGFEVLLAPGGREAVKLYEEHREKVVLVILDLTMPHMDGEETFRHLEKINRKVKIILSSGYNESDTTSRFAGKGQAGFIQKPYSPQALMEKIIGILEIKR